MFTPHHPPQENDPRATEQKPTELQPTVLKPTERPLIAKIREALNGQQGTEEDDNLVQVCEVKHEQKSDAVRSAILILIVEHNDTLHLVFTERPMHMRTSPGEIVCVGGKEEEDDISWAQSQWSHLGLNKISVAQAAALRECKEEIGLEVMPHDVLGELPGFLRELRKNYWMTPVVAFTKLTNLDFSCNPEEVARVILVPVNRWLNRKDFSTPFFELQDDGRALGKGNAYALEVLRRLIEEKVPHQ